MAVVPRAPVASISAKALALLAFRLLLVEPYYIPAGSMAPALEPGDYVLVLKAGPAAEVSAGAVIVFRHPVDSSSNYVKRVIATANQTVEVRNGVVLLNGAALPQTDTVAPENIYASGCRPLVPYHALVESLGGHTYTVLQSDTFTDTMQDYGPVVVPADSLFVLGDNRDNSSDSRVWGFVPLGNVVGVVHERWFSIDECDGKVRWTRLGAVP